MVRTNVCIVAGSGKLTADAEMHNAVSFLPLCLEYCIVIVRRGCSGLGQLTGLFHKVEQIGRLYLHHILICVFTQADREGNNRDLMSPNKVSGQITGAVCSNGNFMLKIYDSTLLLSQIIPYRNR